MLVVSLAAAGASAEVITVDRTLDTCGTTLDGSLRYAIEKANATVGDDVINIAQELSGQTVQLCACLPEVVGHIVLDASALRSALVIDAGQLGACEVFDFERGDAKIVGPIVLDGNGSDARAIHVGSNRVVSLADVTVARFDAPSGRGTVFNQGLLTVTRGRFEKNRAKTGGAINNSGNGQAELTDTVLRANRASLGGAIHVTAGRVAMVRVRAEENDAKLGAVVYLSTGTLSLEKPIFVNNTAVEGAALFLAAGKAYGTGGGIVENTARSGAAIEVLNATLELSNTKIARNTTRDCRVQGTGAVRGCP
jgi:hypothetical protein